MYDVLLTQAQSTELAEMEQQLEAARKRAEEESQSREALRRAHRSELDALNEQLRTLEAEIETARASKEGMSQELSEVVRAREAMAEATKKELGAARTAMEDRERLYEEAVRVLHETTDSMYSTSYVGFRVLEFRVPPGRDKPALSMVNKLPV